MKKTPLKDYVTVSDLAFAVLVLEHHMCCWRDATRSRLKSSGMVNPEEISMGSFAAGLLYEGGIAGRDAKRRHDALCVYFFLNFYSDVKPEAEGNMRNLQTIVDLGVDFDSEMIKSSLRTWNTDVLKLPNKDQIARDIMHRIFYYIQGSHFESKIWLLC